MRPFRYAQGALCSSTGITPPSIPTKFSFGLHPHLPLYLLHYSPLAKEQIASPGTTMDEGISDSQGD